MARILIVDDEESVRSVLVRMLKGGRNDVHQAADGNEALDLLAGRTFDLVITDIIMPNREGLETIRAIRLNWPDIKIIAMSGGAEIENQEFILRAIKVFGASATLKKPFSMGQFQQAVADALS